MYEDATWNIWLGYTDQNRAKNDFVALSNNPTSENENNENNGAASESTGSGLSYENFEPGKPSSVSDRNCVGLDLSHGKWKDWECNTKLRYACMKPRIQYK